MRPLVRLLQALGLALLVALGAGAVVSADSSSFRQAGYPTGPTGPTGSATPTATATATRTPGPTPTATPVPSGKPKVKIKPNKRKASRRKGVKVKVSFNRAGRVVLQARQGRKRLSKRGVNFSTAGRKNTKLKLRKLKRVPAKVKIIAKGRDLSGQRSNTARKKLKVRR